MINIWKIPKETLPKEEQTVVFYVGPYVRVGRYDPDESCFYDFYTCHDYDLDSVNSWAYLSSLISLSRGLKELQNMYIAGAEKYAQHLCYSAPHLSCDESSIIRGHKLKAEYEFNDRVIEIIKGEDNV